MGRSCCLRSMSQALSLILWTVIFGVMMMVGCAPLHEGVRLVEGDFHPPRILAVETRDSHTIELEFDKETEIVPGSLSVSPDLGEPSVSGSGGTKLHLRFPEPTVAGVEYVVDAGVQDARGNSLNFLARVYGHNAYPPDLLINELNPRASTTNPERVELFSRSAGNLAGITLYNGSPSDYNSRFVFPSVEIEAGDYIVLHLRPEGVPEEINETLAKNESGGSRAVDHAWDYWVAVGGGLPSNNGVVSLYTTPRGRIMDAVIWSNRTSDSDQLYRGFGTRKMMDWVDEVVGDGGWSISGYEAAPEDAVNPEGSTATRSTGRNSHSEDTDTHLDWHIVPTSGASFGSVNSDDVYSP